MQRPDDDMLMAFADGELDAAQRLSIEEYLKTNGEARAKVEEFRRTAAAARAALEGPMREEPPQHLVDAILAHKAPGGTERPAARTGDNIVDFASAHSPGRPPVRWRAVAMAASLALLVGGASGYLIGQSASPRTPPGLAIGPAPAASSIAEALERQPSGETRAGVSIVATFRDRHQRICREVEIVGESAAGQPDAAAVACRVEGGRWDVEGVVRLALPTPGAGFEPAGVSERDALEGLLNMLGASQAIAAGQERTLIANGWK